MKTPAVPTYRGSHARLVPGLQEAVQHAVVLSLRVAGVSRCAPQVGLLVSPLLDLAVEVLQRVLAVGAPVRMKKKEEEDKEKEEENVSATERSSDLSNAPGGQSYGKSGCFSSSSSVSAVLQQQQQNLKAEPIRAEPSVQVGCQQCGGVQQASRVGKNQRLLYNLRLLQSIQGTILTRRPSSELTMIIIIKKLPFS